MTRSPGVRSWLCHVLVGASGVAVALGVAGTAQSQGYITNSPSVFVDVDVLDALGPARSTTLLPRVNRPVPVPTTPVTTGELLEPPPTAPVSRLNVPAPTPVTRPARAAPTVAAAPAPPRAPAEAPQPPTAPEPAPDIQTAERPPAPVQPAPTPAPAASAEAPPQPTVPPPASRASLRPPTQVPEPPSVPEAPAVNVPPRPAPAAQAPPIVAEAAADEAPQPPAAPQVAARPDPSDEDFELRLEFDTGSARLPDAGRQPLQQLAGQLDEQGDLRIQLRAYAGGTAETSSLARRLSLSRALAVRSYLIEQGVRSTRMDVRALGNKSGDGPSDRVDVVLVDQ